MSWKSGKQLEEKYVVKSRSELGRFEITIDTELWLDFLELTLADWMEQVEGAAMKSNPYFQWEIGQAYSYRRDAYHLMSKILASERPRLGEVVLRTYEAVMATEPMGTRHLIQPRTPPVTKAASRALDALRSAGVAIPLDLRPKSREMLNQDVHLS